MVHAIIALGAITVLSLTGFMVVGIMWLKKLRESVANNLGETATQQIRTAQRLSEALAQIQKQQRSYEDRLQALSQANAQLRQGLVNMATRLDHTESETTRGDHTLH